MSDRYTRKDADAAFRILIAAIGGRVATAYDDVGAYRLDYAGCYGGFAIERITGDHGGVARPFGQRRYKAREFCAVVHFALEALEERDTLKGAA